MPGSARPVHTPVQTPNLQPGGRRRDVKASERPGYPAAYPRGKPAETKEATVPDGAFVWLAVGFALGLLVAHVFAI